MLAWQVSNEKVWQLFCWKIFIRKYVCLYFNICCQIPSKSKIVVSYLSIFDNFAPIGSLFSCSKFCIRLSMFLIWKDNKSSTIGECEKAIFKRQTKYFRASAINYNLTFLSKPLDTTCVHYCFLKPVSGSEDSRILP